MTVIFDGIAFDGIASGMLLFLISVGLSVTLGLMNFVNLAHGAFAMFGGFVAVTLLNRAGVPFLAALPLAAIATALVGVLFERTLYRRLYAAPHLDQVLFSIGLVFMSVASAHYLFGPQQQPLTLPAFLQGQINLPGLDMGVYRLFLIILGMGINVDRIFTLTFALGTGLAGLGGALGVEMLGLDPGFPVKYIVYFLIVVAVGGSGNITGSLIAALILGVFDVAGKYYVPQAGAFVIYAVMVAMLIFRPQGLFGRKAAR